MPDYLFRPVTEKDLPMLSNWLRAPEVATWWGRPDQEIPQIRHDIDGDIVRMRIACLGAVPLGYAQYYPAHHWPAPHFAHLPADTIAIDVFGAPAGRGHGGLWLRALGDRLLRDVSTLAIDPSPDNLRAIAAYQKAGFSGDRIDRDGEGQTVRVMTRHR